VDGAGEPVERLAVADKLSGDHYGERLGIAHEHGFMGRLVVIPTLVREQADGCLLSINMRRPAGLTREEFRVALSRLADDSGAQQVPEPYIGEPFSSDASGPLVQTLLDIYRHHSGQPDPRPRSIRGGTYARLFPGAVDFGPSMPDRPYRGHAADESMEVDVLELLARMLFDAAVALDDAAVHSGEPPGSTLRTTGL
jgi:hypothetical protein